MSKHQNAAWKDLKNAISNSIKKISETFVDKARSRFQNDISTAQYRNDVEKLIDEVSREITVELKSKKFPLRGKAHFPSHIQIFLSSVDYQDWGVVKLDELTAELSDLCMDIARELGGKLPVANDFIKVKLEIGPSLGKGQVQIYSQWSESSDVQDQEQDIEFLSQVVVGSYIPSKKEQGVTKLSDQAETEDEEITQPRNYNSPLHSDDTEPYDPDATEYFSENEEYPLIKVEVWKNEIPDFELFVRRKKLIIGRNSKVESVDVHLPDSKVHRRHAEVIIEDTSPAFTLTACGERPILIGDKRLADGESISFESGASFKIHNFSVKLTKM